jgi:hypothetical protein
MTETPNEAKMRNLGFSDHNKAHWYQCFTLVPGHVTLNLTIHKGSGAWKEDVLNENSGQPEYYGNMVSPHREEIIAKIDAIIADMASHGFPFKVDHEQYTRDTPGLPAKLKYRKTPREAPQGEPAANNVEPGDPYVAMWVQMRDQRKDVEWKDAADLSTMSLESHHLQQMAQNGVPPAEILRQEKVYRLARLRRNGSNIIDSFFKDAPQCDNLTTEELDAHIEEARLEGAIRVDPTLAKYRKGIKMDRYDKNEHQEKAVQISEEDAHRAKLLKLAEHRTVALGEFMSAQVAKEIEYDKYVLAQVALKNATDWEEQLRIAYKDTDTVFQLAWENLMDTETTEAPRSTRDGQDR